MGEKRERGLIARNSKKTVLIDDAEMVRVIVAKGLGEIGDARGG